MSLQHGLMSGTQQGFHRINVKFHVLIPSLPDAKQFALVCVEAEQQKRFARVCDEAARHHSVHFIKCNTHTR